MNCHCLIGKPAYSIYRQLRLFLSYERREGRNEKGMGTSTQSDGKYSSLRSCPGISHACFQKHLSSRLYVRMSVCKREMAYTLLAVS